eukprot:SAG22_NODE_257_length_13543_cov_26.100417_3_plen_71_part_00
MLNSTTFVCPAGWRCRRDWHAGNNYGHGAGRCLSLGPGPAAGAAGAAIGNKAGEVLTVTVFLLCFHCLSS